MHSGQWFKFEGEETYDNLIIRNPQKQSIENTEKHGVWGTDKPTKISLDAEVNRLQTEYDSNQYQRDRATDYPAIADQLDDIFHNGIDGWKATIQLTKDKYPKGGN
jgi:hypothetical protein